MNLDDFKRLKKGISAFEPEKFYFHNDIGIFTLNGSYAMTNEEGKNTLIGALPTDLQNVVYLTDFDPSLATPRVLLSTKQLHQQIKEVQALRMESKQRAGGAGGKGVKKASKESAGIIAERLVRAALDGSL